MNFVLFFIAAKIFLVASPVVTPVSTPEKICIDKCGNGTCEELVCMGTGCPCAESKKSCEKDCG